MGAPVKFLFEDDFTAGNDRRAKPTVPLAQHEAALARGARATACWRPRARSRRAPRMPAIASRKGSRALTQSLAAVEARLEAESVEVAFAVARKLAPELIAAEPFAEIAALAAGCFRQLIAAPHVVVRIAEPIYEIAHKRLEEIARLHGFEGRLVVLAEPGMAAGDCRIEWADGGLSRDRAATEAAIGEAVGRYVAARRSTDTTSGGLSDE